MGRTRTRTIPSVQTRRMRVADLVPAEFNPRKISDRAMGGLRASLERFGELGGIVVNQRTGRLVGGHQRAKALAALGVDEVEVRVIDVDGEEERAANLALNHSGIGGQWDEEMLSAVLAEVQRDLPTSFDELLLDDLIAAPIREPRTQDEGGSTREVDVDAFELAHTCPRCGFGFDDG